jgi:CO/xanthine dehydrogenase Mo-binding subunit
MAYWQNGKCFVHGSTQSQSFVVPALAGLIGIKPDELVYIGEFCGGGFGSKGSAYPTMAIPALMSKLNKPVMMRISRAEEYFVGCARNGFQGRARLGFAANGRLLAADMYIVQDGGAHNGFWDYRNAADSLSIVYNPVAMRWRGVPVYTNTPTRSAQRGPGENQIACALEPLLDKAARELKIDRLQIRSINAPKPESKVGRERRTVTSAYLADALAKGAADFKWEERRKRSGQRNGSRVTGIGIGQAYHPAGFNGFDGLVRITPDGKLHIHTGVGNLGTFSHSGTARIAAEVLKYDWENCIVERGDTRKGLPWNIGQFGSNTSFTMARTNYVAAMDALQKMKEIAAQDLGGKPDDYDVDGSKVFRKSDASKSLSRPWRAPSIWAASSPARHRRTSTADRGVRDQRCRHVSSASRKQPAGGRRDGGVCRCLHRDRARSRDGHASHRRLRERGRLRHRHPPDGARDAAQRRLGAGLRPRVSRAPRLRPAEWPAGPRWPASGETAYVSRRADRNARQRQDKPDPTSPMGTRASASRPWVPPLPRSSAPSRMRSAGMSSTAHP